MARFAAVAAANPLATRRQGYSAEQLVTVNDDNRWIGFPYPKLMNAHAFIDQSAAVVMTSVATARELGIPRDKWVFLHGCADAHDHWYVSERVDLHSSPAIRAASRQALDMAGKTLADIDVIDLYSCFASAVQIGCREIGLAEDDPRGLTVTGGLPFFGGPGNNYVTHSISEMMRRLRARPGAFGLVTANGNYVTKHSFGVYSTAAPAGPWRRERPAVLQSRMDALPKAPFTETPQGEATIETYTVMHGKAGPEFAVVFGRLNATGQRFIANLPRRPGGAVGSAESRQPRPARAGDAGRRPQSVHAPLIRQGDDTMYPGKYATQHPDRAAFIMASTGEAVSYRDFEARSNRLAHLLRSQGLQRLDHYAMFLENNNRFLESCSAGYRAGLYFTCINSYLTAEELAYIVNNSESKLLITSRAKLAVAAEALKSCPQVKLCLVVDGGALTLAARLPGLRHRHRGLSRHADRRRMRWARRCCTHRARQAGPRASCGRCRNGRRLSRCRSSGSCRSCGAIART